MNYRTVQVVAEVGADAGIEPEVDWIACGRMTAYKQGR